MKAPKNFQFISLLVITSITFSCSSSGRGSEVKDRIAGKYASESESTFDYYRDTVEIKPTDDGKFDVQTIAHWSNAKKDDPNRPANKVAGVWNKGKTGSVLVADFQASDTTLRIVGQLRGGVNILSFDVDKGVMQWPSDDGETVTYTKISE
ncbi:hypothetical protein [Olivibacter jilunii]|uniref:hypothetical protein n=1 Tax=Olivibacter jilunii TaxID=985016 RepID=UPI00102F509F|nr:hypothetical protein [Olivibacter jilunii]